MTALRLATLFAVLVASTSCRDSRLKEAVDSMDKQATRTLIADKSNVDINATDANRRTALHAAIEAVNKDAYLQLLAAGADPNVCDRVGTSVVHLAAQQRDVFWLREALNHGGDPNRPNVGNPFVPNSTPLHYALEKRRVETSLELIERGADVNHLNNDNVGLHVDAMGNAMYRVMIVMIKAGADPRKGVVTIFANGWFSEDYETSVRAENRADYEELKQLLIDRGYLPEPNKSKTL